MYDLVLFVPLICILHPFAVWVHLHQTASITPKASSAEEEQGCGAGGAQVAVRLLPKAMVCCHLR